MTDLYKLIEALEEYINERKQKKEFYSVFQKFLNKEASDERMTGYNKSDKITAARNYLFFIKFGDILLSKRDIKILKQGSLSTIIRQYIRKLDFTSIDASILNDDFNIHELYIKYEQLKFNDLSKDQESSGFERIRYENYKLKESFEESKNYSEDDNKEETLQYKEYTSLNRSQKTKPQDHKNKIFTGIEFEICKVSEYKNAHNDMKKDHQVIATFKPKSYFQEVLETDDGRALEYVPSPRFINKNSYLDRVCLISVITYLSLYINVFGFLGEVKTYSYLKKKNKSTIRKLVEYLEFFFNKRANFNDLIVTEDSKDSKITTMTKSKSGCDFQINLSAKSIPKFVLDRAFSNIKNSYVSEIYQLNQVLKINSSVNNHTVLSALVTYIRHIPVMLLEIIHSESTDTNYKHRNISRAFNILMEYYFSGGNILNDKDFHHLHSKLMYNSDLIYEKYNTEYFNSIGKWKRKGNILPSLKKKKQNLFTNRYISPIKDINDYWCKSSLGNLLKKLDVRINILDEEELVLIMKRIFNKNPAYKKTHYFLKKAKLLTTPKESILSQNSHEVIGYFIKLFLKDITGKNQHYDTYYRKELGNIKKYNEYKTIGARQDTYIQSDNVVFESRSVSSIFEKPKNSPWVFSLMDKLFEYCQINMYKLSTYDEIINTINELDQYEIAKLIKTGKL